MVNMTRRKMRRYFTISILFLDEEDKCPYIQQTCCKTKVILFVCRPGKIAEIHKKQQKDKYYQRDNGK